MAYSDYMPTDYPDFADHDEVIDWTGPTRWNAIYTVQLGELIEKGVFDWSLEILDWSEAAYDQDQYQRICEYFVQRFMYREISIEPFAQWATMLKRKLIYEIMPKFKPLYEHLDSFDPTLVSDKYRKRRAIGSDYPETLLSANSDYISNGQDEEEEELERGNLAQSYEYYVETFKGIDESLLDQLESMFIGLYSTSIDGM